MKGKRAKPAPYRDGQNAVRDQSTNAIVYLPPEAGDVPAQMAEMVAWVKRSEKERLPAPLIAGLLHYQFVTIHPYYDGNGRTARLLATFILQRDGYGLEGLFSRTETLSTGEMAAALGISARMARNLVNEWIATDFLVSIGAAKKTRRYGLTEEYRKYIGNE